ncbi:MAG: Hydrolase (HAD superfamily), YqeK [Firmicutes bacterium]|nr:Hydrolase (HAD superfamily), YqeK [Bacillota bacterium]
MYNMERIKDRLQKMLSVPRLMHSIRVKEEAEKLAMMHNADIIKAGIAGLLHDCARDMAYEELLNRAGKSGIILDSVTIKSPKIIHAVVGPLVAKEEFGIHDTEVLDAIRYHTTGRKEMRILEKIVFIADLTEPGRDFRGVEKIRELSERDIDRAVLFALDQTIIYLIEGNKLIHEDTLKARNYLYLIEA